MVGATFDVPPPPPSRRQAGGSHGGNTEPEENQSYSAPSSPTHGPTPPPRLGVGSDTSGTSASSRPRSMAFPSTGNPVSDNQGKLPTYADLHFTHGAPHHPVPRPRRTVNYTEIAQTTVTVGTTSSHPAPPPGHPIPPPRSAVSEARSGQTIICESPTHLRQQKPSDDEEENSSSPPPPVPFRIIGTAAGSSTSTTSSTNSASITDIDTLKHLNLDLPPLPPKDPFASEPFPIDLDIPSWDMDTHGFSSKASSDHHDVLPVTIYSENLDLNRMDSEDNADLCTGSSAYEDASEIIEAAVMRNRTDNSQKKLANVLKPPGLNVVEEGSEEEQRSRPVSAEYDVPPAIDLPASASNTNSQSAMDDSPSSSPYQFPQELDIHPHLHPQKSPIPMEDNVSPQATYDEPPLEVLTFPSPRAGRGTSSSRQNDVGRSAHITQQQLPPIPTDTAQQRVPNPLFRSASCDPSSSASQHRRITSEPPPLPPMNSRLNAPVASSRWGTNGQLEPPLPPRNPSSRTSPPGPALPLPQPPGPACSSRSHQQHEQLVMDLVNRGFSRNDVVKALAIAQNKPDLACSILEGFGSRGQ